MSEQEKWSTATDFEGKVLKKHEAITKAGDKT